MDVNDNGAAPVFLIENDVYAVAGEPTTAEPTEIAGVLLVARIVVLSSTCNAGTGAAVPVTTTFILNDEVVGSFVTIVIVPVFAPIAAGVPVTVNVAVPPAAIVAGAAGVIAVTAKPVEPVMDVNDNGPVPVFLIENDVYAVAGEATTAVPTEIAGLLLLVTIVVEFNTCNAGTVPVTDTFIL